ncbi:MAG: cadherin domain-containing protein [Rhodocyclaceae bacterium]|nr:cadherin domain-containing protein [Rhodocyclaceae bacterium]
MAITTSKSGAETNGSAVQSGASGFSGQAGKKTMDTGESVKPAVESKGKSAGFQADAGKFEDLVASARKIVNGKAKRKPGDEEENGNAAVDDVNDQADAATTQAEYSDDRMVLALADTATPEAAPAAGTAASSTGAAAGGEAAGGTALGGGSAASGTAVAAGVSSQVMLGAALAVGIAASGTSGGGGGGSSVAAATGFTLSGTIALGKINDATGLVVEAFKADGTKLAGTGTVNADGTFSIAVTENYSGPVLVRLKDTNAGTNYNDEGTGLAKDLATDLRAVVNVSGNGTITVAITPLTELAVRELVGDSGGDAGTASTTLGSTVTTTQVTTANDNVKTAFGLSGDITTTVPVTVDDATAFNAGTAAQKAYGQALAAIAGAEADQGASTGEVLTALSEGLVGTTLSISAVDALIAGAAVADGIAGNVTGTETALETAIGVNIGGIALSADTGAAGDFITQTAAQTITATLDAALSGKLWGSVDGGTTWTDISSFVSGTALTWTGVTLVNGDNLIKFAVTAGTVTNFTGATADVVGKVSAQSYAVDTTAPTFTSTTSASFAENGAGTAYDAAATDAHLLTYTLGGTDVARFNIDPSSGVVTFAAVPDFEAPADSNTDNTFDITVTATDGAGNTTTQSVAVAVTNVNETPALTSGTAASFAENGTGTVYTTTATDPDAGTTPIYALGGADAALFNISSSTGAITFKAAPNFEAPTDAGGNNVYDVTVTASDGSLTTAAQAVAITVTNVNEAPTVTSGASASIAENTATSTTVYTATATDPDAGTTLTYTLAGSDALLFDIDASTGAVTFKAQPDRETPTDTGGDSVYDITVTATDNGAGALNATQTVAITVTNVNETPTSTTVTATTAVTNQTYSFNVSGSFSDPDVGTTLSYSATGLPAGLTISSAGVISGTATTEDLTNSVTVTATDGSLTTQQTFNLPVVSAPTITAIAADVAQANSGDALTFTATLSESVTITTGTTAPTLTFDVNGQTMTATYSGGNSTNTGTLTFTATAPGTVDDASVTVSAISLGDATITGNTSQQGFVTSATGQAVSGFVIDNNVPVFTSGTTVTFVENATGTVYTAATTDSTAVTYALSGTDAGSFTLTNGALTFDSTPNFETKSSYSVTIAATDALSQTANQNVTVNVTNANEAPTVVGGAPTTETLVVGQALSGDEIASLFTDVDTSDTLTYSQTGLPSELALNSTNGAITGTPATAGTANVTFTATDVDGLSVSHTIAVSVVNAPTVTNTATLDDVVNLDARSDLVLTFSDTISLGSGQIRIMDDMGTSGWTLTNTTTGESKQDTTDNDVIITLTNGAVTGLTIGGVDKSADMADSVTASGNVLTISPAGSDNASSTDWDFDWDFGASYHIELDAGVVTANGVGNVAIGNSTTLNFTTVTPAGNATGAASQKMAVDGTLTAGYTWHHGHVSDATASGEAMNFGTGSHGLVLQSDGLDIDTDGAGPDIATDKSTTTIGGKILLSGLGTDDVIYLDNMGNMSLLSTDGHKGATYTGSGNSMLRYMDNSDGGLQLQTVFADYSTTGYTAITAVGSYDLMLENASHYNANLVIFG